MRAHGFREIWRQLFVLWFLSTVLISCMATDMEGDPSPKATLISKPTDPYNLLEAPVGSKSPPIIPSPTPHPTPCAPFCARVFWSATPGPSTEAYHLKQWTFEDALEVIEILDDRWELFNEENDYWNYGMMVVNQQRYYTAFVAQEAIWRFPENPDIANLKWKASHDLAVAGEQEASSLLAELLEETLNQQEDQHEPNLSFLWQKGFESELIPMFGLSGEDSFDWLVKVSKRYDEMPIVQWDGAILSINKVNETYLVTPVDNFWMAWHGDKYEVILIEHEDENITEITVTKEAVAGTGSAFKSATSCIYQWQENRWVRQPIDAVCDVIAPASTLWAGDVSAVAKATLFSGGDPNEVIVQLRSALSSPDFWCYGEYCAQIYYLLGLSYEIIGDEDNAVEIYWRLWNDYPDSSQAIIVQYKLETDS